MKGLALFLDNRQVSVVLNIIYRHPRELVPFSPEMYDRYFNERTVPIEKTIRNRNGEVSVVMVKKEVALNFLKNRYNFINKSDLSKELNDAHSNL